MTSTPPTRDVDARRRRRAADAQRSMSFVKYTAARRGRRLHDLSRHFGGTQHRRPSIHHHGGHDAPHHGPPRPPRPSKEP